MNSVGSVLYGRKITVRHTRFDRDRCIPVHVGESLDEALRVSAGEPRVLNRRRREISRTSIIDALRPIRTDQAEAVRIFL
jgi:hypothetical protein